MKVEVGTKNLVEPGHWSVQTMCWGKLESLRLETQAVVERCCPQRSTVPTALQVQAKVQWWLQKLHSMVSRSDSVEYSDPYRSDGEFVHTSALRPRVS